MAVKKLKVRYLDGNAKYVGIKLQGKWLKECGFKEDDIVDIEIKKNKIVIRKDTN